MTETRKPYDPTWPHGFETRDGRKAIKLGDTIDGSIIWQISGEECLLSTSSKGHEDYGHPSDLDIFCAPSPAEKPLESWVNVDLDGNIFGPYRSTHRARKVAEFGGVSCYTRIAVHMREVTSEPATKESGSLSAEQVEELASGWEVGAEDTDQYNTGAIAMFQLLSKKLRDTARDATR